MPVWESQKIAQIDKIRIADAEDNLAFLCFEHHDEYDSSTSQRKGLTIGEVKAYRAELHKTMGAKFSVDVHFGTLRIPEGDPHAGKFIRTAGVYDSADIDLTPIPDGPDGRPRYAVTGFALWGTDCKYSPNIGELGFIGILEDGIIEHVEAEPGDRDNYKIRLSFRGDVMIVEELNEFGIHGAGVTFNGKYQRA